ncbi:MAG: pilin [Candidatus Paceibacterota bacterium]
MKKILLPILLLIGTILSFQQIFSSSFEDIYSLNVVAPTGQVIVGDRVKASIDARLSVEYTMNYVEVDMGGGFYQKVSCVNNICAGEVSSIYTTAGKHDITARLCYLDTDGGVTRCPPYGIQDNPPYGVCCVTETSQIEVEPKMIDECPNGVIDPEEECDGNNFNGKTCIDYGFTEGNLQCNENCLIDTSKCITTEEPKLPDRYPNALLWENIIDFLKYIVIWIFRIGSGLALLMMLIGAFIMATSAGDRNRAEKGKRTVIWAIIGFVVTMTVNGIIALVQALVGFENI